MKIIDCEQRTPEWFAARLGRLTASRASDMLGTLKSGGESAGRRNLRAQLVLERLTGKSQDSGYQSEAMRIGIEREPDALLWYEAQTGQIVTRSGFVAHDTLMAGASLDGSLDSWRGIVEVKCPIPATHLDTLQSGKVPKDYADQILHQLWITGAAWGDYVSFHPDLPERLRLKILRVERINDDIRFYEAKATAFLAEVDRDVATLLTMENLSATLTEAIA